MVGPWMLSSQYAVYHGRHHGWCMDALFSERSRPPAWMLFCQRASDHGRYHGLGHGCSVLRTDYTMDVIMIGLWMLCAQNALDHGRHHCPPWMLSCQIAAGHGRYHDWAMDALLSECLRPWTVSWFGWALYALCSKHIN